LQNHQAMRRIALLLLVFSSSPALAAKADLAGRRLADKILIASDSERIKVSPLGIEMALRRHGAKRVALRADFLKAHNTKYSKELPPTPIRDQSKTGRCWIFTALNVMERDAKLAGKKAEKLSRAYIDAKNLQAVAYELIHTGFKAGLLRGASNSDVGEGGSFGYALQVIERYGAVPERVMRDFHDGKASAVLLKQLETIVVDAQEKLLKTGRNTPESFDIVKKAHEAVDTAIALAFTGKSKLPEKFVVDGKEYTPKTYAKEHLGIKPGDYVTLQDARDARAGWRTFGADVHETEVYNTRNVEFMKQTIKNAIDLGRKVYISLPVSDASAPFSGADKAYAGLPSSNGILSIGAHDYASLGLPAAITDREIIQRNGLYPTNHAMTVVGYDLGPDGKVVKWKLENSWGQNADRTDRGYMHVYDDFLTSFVGNITVPRGAVGKKALDRLESEKKALDTQMWLPK
jgi:bleomycin hydrolase